MPQQNIIQQKVQAEGTALPGQVRSVPIQSGIASGLAALSQGVAQATEYYDTQKYNEDTLWAGNKMADGNMYWDKKLTEMQNAAQPGADGFVQSVGNEFRAYREQTLQEAKDKGLNPKAMDNLVMSLKKQEASLFAQSLNFTDRAKKEYNVYQAGQMLDKSMKIAQDNPAGSGQTYLETMKYIDSLAVDPIVKTGLLEKAQKDIAYASGLGLVQQAPEASAKLLRESIVPLTGKTQFDQTMEFIFKREGGLNPNDGGGISNYGINSVANPDVDVKNITKQGAKEIYKDRYWDAIGASHLPPGVALMAMDAAVNQGVPYAKKLLKESNGDINKMAEMRAEKYASLVSSNPQKYGKYQSEWNDRLQEATQLATQLGGSGTGFLDPQAIEVQHVIQTNRPVIDALSFGDRIKLLNYADRQIEQQKAEQNAMIKRKFNNFELMAKQGAEIPAQSVPTANEMMSYYGPIEGLTKYQQDVQGLVQLNGDMRAMASMSIQERDALIKQRQPVPGDNFIGQYDRYQTLVSANEKLLQDMKKDSAGYALEHSDQVRSSYQQMIGAVGAGISSTQEARIAAQNYAAISEQEQLRLGITTPKILPENVKAYMLTQMNSVAPNGGETAAKMMAAQADIWGSYWPNVYAELAPKLPPAALVVGSGLRPDVAEILARTANLKTEELTDGLEKGAVESIRTEVNSLSSSDFMKSMMYSVGGEKTYSVFQNQIERLAYIYHKRGMSESEAADTAYNDIIGSKYEFVYNDRQTTIPYRVPLDRDVSKISSTASDYLAKGDLSSLDIGRVFGKTGEFADKKAFYENIRNNGYWVTSNMEDGLSLYINGRVAMNKDGSEFKLTWDQLTPVVPEPPQIIYNPDRVDMLKKSIDAFEEMEDSPYRKMKNYKKQLKDASKDLELMGGD